MQVYKYMDIGTCKPDKNILKQVPHHLIDIIEPDKQFNTGEFVREADKLIKSIVQRGNTPVLSGGTAFYFKNFIYGMPEVPESKKDIRELVYKKLKDNGLEKLYHDLIKIDKEYAEKISINDNTRILRALEVYEQTGKPLSSFKLPENERKEYKFLLIGLKRPKAELFKRIEERVDILFGNGLLDEVKKLISMGYNSDDPGMKGIGYREIMLMRNGDDTVTDVADKIKKNSKAYAKRQMTFFNSFKNVFWYHPDELVSINMRIKEFMKIT